MKKDIIDNAVDLVIRDISKDERDEIKTYIKNNSENVKALIAKGRMEKNSFLEPVTFEASRTTQSVPCKGYTSISRIAKG